MRHTILFTALAGVLLALGACQCPCENIDKKEAGGDVNADVSRNLNTKSVMPRGALIGMFGAFGSSDLQKHSIEYLWQITPAPTYTFKSNDNVLCSARVVLMGALWKKNYTGELPFFEKSIERVLVAQGKDGKFTSTTGKDITELAIQAFKAVDAITMKKWQSSDYDLQIALGEKYLKANPAKKSAGDISANPGTQAGLEKILAYALAAHAGREKMNTKKLFAAICQIRNMNRSFGQGKLQGDHLYQATALLILSILNKHGGVKGKH